MLRGVEEREGDEECDEECNEDDDETSDICVQDRPCRVLVILV